MCHCHMAPHAGHHHGLLAALRPHLAVIFHCLFASLLEGVSPFSAPPESPPSIPMLFPLAREQVPPTSALPAFGRDATLGF
ncbi:unnamed protein product [Rangifer tarandus platyrhynchus]|uniref:Uncharacterized protein n=2 Tax=Rangifer tarandus platyrhynchus TaxID=3082113 RepID=A0ACB0ENW1_RANTA|nr:unnamed protein product [Rangifer tarandus platyrhynchus]CAI9702398.1 unnamed protein product [Rangifer tarandus platyrhynchus]